MHGSEADRLYELLRVGDSAQATALVLSLYLEGWSAAQIVDGPLGVAMDRIGRLRKLQPTAIYCEHRATQIAIETMVRLRSLLPAAVGNTLAVGGAVPEDPCILPSLAAAVVLHGQGLHAINLGPDTPLESLELAISETWAGLAWLSVSVIGNAETLAAGIDRMVASLAPKKVALVVGGREASRLDLKSSAYLYRSCSMAELEALSQGVRLAESPTAA